MTKFRNGRTSVTKERIHYIVTASYTSHKVVSKIDDYLIGSSILYGKV